MSTKKIAVSTLWQFGSQATMALLSVLTVKFVAVGLSKELAGNYNSAYGYLQLFGILADFGLYAVAVQEVSRAKNRASVLGTLITLRSIILCISLFIALSIVWNLRVWEGTPFPLSVTIAAFVPFFTLLAGILRTVFQVQYKLQYVFIAEVTQRIVTVLLIGSFIVFGLRLSTEATHLYTFLAFGGVGSLTLFLLSIFYAKRFMSILPRWDTVLLTKLFKQAAPFGIAYLCMALYRQLDITLIALLRPDFELQNAYYGFVVRITDMAFLIPTFILNSALPILSKKLSDGKETKYAFGKILILLLSIGSVLSLFSYVWARPIIELLTTDAYLSKGLTPGSDSALQILSVSIFFNGLILYGFYVLLTTYAWKPLVLAISSAALFSLLLNLHLIPDFGFIGAAWTSAITHILLAGLLFPISLTHTPAVLPRNALLQWAAFTIFLGIGLVILRPYLLSPLFTLLGCGIASLYIAILLVLTGLKRVLTLALNE